MNQNLTTENSKVNLKSTFDQDKESKFDNLFHSGPSKRHLKNSSIIPKKSFPITNPYLPVKTVDQIQNQMLNRSSSAEVMVNDENDVTENYTTLMKHMESKTSNQIFKNHQKN